MSGCLGSDDGSMYGPWVGMSKGYLCRCDYNIRVQSDVCKNFLQGHN